MGSSLPRAQILGDTGAQRSLPQHLQNPLRGRVAMYCKQGTFIPVRTRSGSYDGDVTILVSDSVYRDGGAVRLDSLTGLRWWAAFAVFLYHMRIFAPIPLTGEIVGYGDFGVAFFFILSGFVLTWSARSGTRRKTFWWRRFARIYPAHLAALLLAIPVFYSFTPAPDEWWVKPVSVGVLLLSFVLLQGWWTDPAVLFSGNPAAWTLTCEAFFYALHPFLHRAFSTVRARGALILTICVFAIALAYRVAIVLSPEAWYALLPLPIVRLSEFVIGIGIAHAMLSGWRPKLPPVVWYLVGGAMLAWLIASQRFGFTDPLSTWFRATDNEWIMLLFAITIAAVAVRDLRGHSSLLRAAWLVKLGEWSFCFYLLHATIMYAFLAAFGAQPASWMNIAWHAAVFSLALIGSWALHSFLERPVERRMRRWWDARDKTPTAAVTAL